MPTEQQTETRREVAQKVVREWAEHDMNEHYGSNYLRDEFGSEHLEARIEAALNAQAERDARIADNRAKELKLMATAAFLSPETVRAFKSQASCLYWLSATIRSEGNK